jgi:predicted Zn finger-like uncharacterized protein
MIVQCPSCHTTYRVSDNLITNANPTFRCSRCKHVFVIAVKPAPPAVEPEAKRPSPQPASENQELNFPFPPAEPPQPPPLSRDDSVVRFEPDETTKPPAEIEEPSTDAPRGADSWSIAPPPPAKEQPFTMIAKEEPAPVVKAPTRPPASREERPQLIAKPTPATEPPVDSPLDQPLSTAPYLALCAALFVFFSIVALAYKAQPAPVERLLKKIPWLNSSLFRSSHLRRGITIQAVVTRFQRIQGNKDVFVVSGRTVNHNPVKVREVRVEGYTFGGDGKIIEQQTTMVGNAISAKIVRDLSKEDIAALQNQPPVKRFELPPEESSSFAIVFFKSSGDIKSFSFRVVSAEEA